MAQLSQITGKLVNLNGPPNAFFEADSMPISKIKYFQITIPPFISNLRFFNSRGK